MRKYLSWINRTNKQRGKCKYQGRFRAISKIKHLQLCESSDSWIRRDPPFANSANETAMYSTTLKNVVFRIRKGLFNNNLLSND